MSLRSLARSAAPARWLRSACAAALSVILLAPAVAQPTVPGAVPAEIAFDEARGLYDGGLYGPSERAFAQFLDAFPRDARAPEALYLRAESALLAGDDRTAAALFGQFEERYPTHPFAARARLALGRFYYARGQDDLAEIALLQARESGPPEARAEAGYLLGLVYRRSGTPSAASGAFERAATDDTPTAPLALYALGALAAETQDWPTAASAFGRLQDRYPSSPQNREAGLAYAEALVRTGRLDEGADQADRRRPDLVGEDAARAALLSGETRLRLGETDAADGTLALVPSGSRYARRAALARGRVASSRSEWPAAVEFYRTARAEAADRGVDDAVAHEASYYEGLALVMLGDLGEAETRLLAAAERRPDGPYAQPALLELGYLQYGRRRYADAVQAFQRLVEVDPRGTYAGEATRMLGEAYAASGDASGARSAFERAEALGTATSETRSEVAFQDAYALFTSERYADAVPALLAVYEREPTGPRAGEALFWAGESAFRIGEYARSETILTDFLTRFPGHPRSDAARYVVAWTHFRRRDFAAAADGFERFLSAYQRSSELVPYYADALLRLGDAYTALGRFAEARAVYARVPAATTERQGGDYALYQTAQAFGREGQGDQALSTYDQLLREYPASPLFSQALLAQGAIYSARGDGDLAIAAYERVLNEKPSSDAAPAALLGVGDVLLNRGDARLAEIAYRSVFTQYPGSAVTADAFTGLADALDAQGQGDTLDQAFADIDATLTGVEARTRLRYARARLALSSGQDSLAVVYLEETLAGGPTPDVEAEALLSLAGAYSGQGRPREAASSLRRLLGRYPDSPLATEAELRLAEALAASGDFEGSRAAAARVSASGDPDRAPDALALEAEALVRLDRPDEADARLRSLVRRYPDSAAARAALRDRPDLGDTPDLGDPAGTGEDQR